MVSSINHHLSILHLRVHRRYLDILTSGKSDCSSISDTHEQPWYVLKLRRTKWYDLLNGEDRVSVFQGVWSIFHYLMRKT